MAETKDPRRLARGPADIDVTRRLGGMAFLDGGYALPRKFTVIAVFKDQPLTVKIDVEIEEKRARSREVRVRTDRPGGVSSTTLRTVPIRDLVATACSKELLEVEHKSGANFTAVPIRAYGSAEVQAIKGLVGYV